MRHDRALRSLDLPIHEHIRRRYHRAEAPACSSGPWQARMCSRSATAPTGVHRSGKAGGHRGHCLRRLLKQWPGRGGRNVVTGGGLRVDRRAVRIIERPESGTAAARGACASSDSPRRCTGGTSFSARLAVRQRVGGGTGADADRSPRPAWTTSSCCCPLVQLLSLRDPKTPPTLPSPPGPEAEPSLCPPERRGCAGPSRGRLRGHSPLEAACGHRRARLEQRRGVPGRHRRGLPP